MKLLNITDHHKQLKPIIKAINSTPQYNTFLCADILDRIDRTITQYNLVKTKQDLVNFLQDSLDNIFDFMNYPSLDSVESYVNDYLEDFQLLQTLDSYFIDDNDPKHLTVMYYNGISTILFEFLSLIKH